MSKGRKVFAVIGYGLFGLVVGTFFLRVLWQVTSGHGGDTYYNYKNQPMTYIGMLIAFGFFVVLGIVALYYRAKRFIEAKRKSKTETSSKHA